MTNETKQSPIQKNECKEFWGRIIIHLLKIFAYGGRK